MKQKKGASRCCRWHNARTETNTNNTYLYEKHPEELYKALPESKHLTRIERHHSPFFNQHSSSEDVLYLKKSTRFPAWKTWWILRLRESYLPCNFRLMKRSARAAKGKRCFTICFTRIFQVSGWFTSRVYIQLIRLSRL